MEEPSSGRRKMMTTNKNITNDEEVKIRKHIESVLEILGRHDIVVSLENSIPDMDRDMCDNFYKFKQYAGTLFDVSRDAL